MAKPNVCPPGRATSDQRNSSADKTTLIHILGLALEAQVLGLDFTPKSLLASLLSCPTTAQAGLPSLQLSCRSVVSSSLMA